MKTSAQQLKGMTLDGGWHVVEHLDLQDVTTGCCFSESYIVVDPDGRRAFLKALDYSRAVNEPDPAEALKAMTEAYVYERNLLYRCRERRLDRVVMPLADGTVRFPGAWDLGVVQYLILELGDADFRTFAARSQRVDLAWVLRALHHMTTGVRQLHGLRIAHQDLKPSNVVVFGRDVSKVADLGRASSRENAAPHEEQEVAGDPTYAPPELLYRHLDGDWNRRRFGCDAYLVGSMVVFCFCGVGMTSLLATKLLPEHRWGRWAGSYEEILPYLRDAFEHAIDDFTRAVPEDVRDPLVRIVRDLCDPDPRLRGDPHARGSSAMQYQLERYVSHFNLLARRAELLMVGQPHRA